MKLLVTGASGFLGTAVVRAAAAAGHEVLALVRPTARIDGRPWPSNVEVVRGDLRQAGAWCERLASVEAVIHLAAAPSGDLATQFTGTVVATENLLALLPARGLARFVHVSSFSVYDYGAVPLFGRLTEDTPIEPNPRDRDAYTWTKMIQEDLVREACASADIPLVVLRPGAIFGPGKDWDFGRAMKLGRLDLIFSPMGRFRLTHVESCSDAIVKALEPGVAGGGIFNIVDDELPSYWSYHRLCRRQGAKTGVPVPVPWLAVAALGWSVRLFNRFVFGGRAKLPEFLALRRQRARWRPVGYSNRAAKAGLGWTPRTPLRAAVRETVRAGLGFEPEAPRLEAAESRPQIAEPSRHALDG